MGCIVQRGDSIWMVCDTVLENDGYFYSNSSSTFGGMAVLPSGSIIAAGKTIRVGIANPRNLGWLYKVTANGCIDTLCDLSTALFPPKAIPEKIKVFPNPAQSELNIQLNGNFDLKLFDILGRELRFIKDQRQSFVMSIDDLKEGVYFLQLLREDAIIDVKQIVIQR